jgi:hypothetical protein
MSVRCYSVMGKRRIRALEQRVADLEAAMRTHELPTANVIALPDFPPPQPNYETSVIQYDEDEWKRTAWNPAGYA